MDYTLLVVAVIAAVIDWIAVWRGWRTLEYVLKPGVMLLLFAWFIQAAGVTGQAGWFVVGLICSLAGDIFLMIPRNLFIAGLAAFLVAHLTYASGFTPTLPPVTATSILIAVVIGIAAISLYRKISMGIGSRPGSTGLRYGVLAYSIAISLMVLSAVLTLLRPEWPKEAAWLAAAGGLLFLSSDSLLALDRFVQPIHLGRVMVMITYHLGQFALMLGVARQLAG